MKKLAGFVLFGLLLAAQSFAQNQWKTTEKTNAMDNVTIRTASLESDAIETQRFCGGGADVRIH